MKVLIAILITLGIMMVWGQIDRLSGFHHGFWIMVASTAAWAAFDSSKIQLARYQSGLPYGPVLLFFLIAGFWIVGFPWYLVIRFKIKAGEAILKDAKKAVKSEPAGESSSELENGKPDDYSY